MQIEKSAMAGTLESSDVRVTVEPGANGIELDIESSVMNQYGRAIQRTVLETLERLGVQSVRIQIVDQGAHAWNVLFFAVPEYQTRMFRGEVQSNDSKTKTGAIPSPPYDDVHECAASGPD